MGLDLQKASISKRLAAFMIDFFIFILLFALIASLFSTIFGYGESIKAFTKHYEKYEEKYDIDSNISREEYDKLPDDVKQRYEAATKELEEDIEEVTALYLEIATKTFLVIAVSLFFTFIITELAVPLFLKNGQTVGKKLFSIGLMRVDNIKVTHFQMFVRAIVGKFIIETLIPVMLIILEFFGVLGGIGYIVVALYIVVQLIMFFVTKNKYALHDALAVTVAVDMQTQMIFDSSEELAAYKAKLHEEEVQNSPY